MKDRIETLTQDCPSNPVYWNAHKCIAKNEAMMIPQNASLAPKLRLKLGTNGNTIPNPIRSMNTWLGPTFWPIPYETVSGGFGLSVFFCFS